MPKRFNDDMIRRRDLPVDCFLLLHDLCYHHEGRDVNGYVLRAQKILRSAKDISAKEAWKLGYNK